MANLQGFSFYGGDSYFGHLGNDTV